MVILLDIQEYIEHSRKLSRIIGGWIFADIHELTSKDVEPANRIKLTLIR